MAALMLQVSLVTLLGAMSPGPDTLLVTRETLRCGRLQGLLTTVGMSLGLAVHTLYCAAGLGVMLMQSPVLSGLLRWVGAGYLLYLAVSILRHANDAPAPSPDGSARARGAGAGVVLRGLLANLLNPKAVLFVLAVLTPTLPLLHTAAQKAWVAACVVLMHFTWNATLAMLLANPSVRAVMLRTQTGVNRVFGCALLGLSASVLLQ